MIYSSFFVFVFTRILYDVIIQETKNQIYSYIVQKYVFSDHF